jgi:ferritin-like metal-binding protein YciE
MAFSQTRSRSILSDGRVAFGRHPAITAFAAAAIAWANMLGRSDCASVLQQNLDEEKATDTKLNALALKSVNRKAA